MKSENKVIQSIINWATKNNIKLGTIDDDKYTAITIKLNETKEKGSIKELHYTKTGDRSYNKLTPRVEGFLPYGYYTTQSNLLKDIKEWDESLNKDDKKLLGIKINESFIIKE